MDQPQPHEIQKVILQIPARSMDDINSYMLNLRVDLLTLNSNIKCMAVYQQELLWETTRTTFEIHPDMTRAQELTSMLFGFRMNAEGIVRRIADRFPIGPLPQIHPAVTVTRDPNHKIIIKFQPDLRDYLPIDSQPPEAVLLS